MTVSLIITTYNWPRALYLCLDSVMQQTVMPSEILVADDGSGISTRDVVRHFQNISPVPVRHIWHEDNGFRLAAIRNKAIAASKGKYIIQIDGDLILQRNFIQDHMLFAREGCFVTGSRGIITELLTRKVLSGEITNWSEVGGPNQTIQVIIREDGSGTRDCFDSAMEKVDEDFISTQSAVTCQSTGLVIQNVQNTAGSIGYISIGQLANL